MKSFGKLALAAVFTAAASMGAVDSGLLNLVMPDAKILTGVQVDQATMSPFGQFILSQMQPDAGFLTFISSTGFDPRHDLREILGATSASKSGLLLGKGTFQVGQIVAAATAKGGTVTVYNTISIISDNGKGNGAIAFLNGNTAIIGDLASVQGAIDRRNATQPVADATLIQKAQAASTTNTAWFATTTPLSDFLSGKVSDPNLNNLAQNNLFQNILQASGGVNLANGGVLISADAVTSSSQNAQALADVLKFLVSMIPANANNDQVKSLADAATFTASGMTMHMALPISEQQAEQLFMSAPKPAARARRY